MPKSIRCSCSRAAPSAPTTRLSGCRDAPPHQHLRAKRRFLSLSHPNVLFAHLSSHSNLAFVLPPKCPPTQISHLSSHPNVLPLKSRFRSTSTQHLATYLRPLDSTHLDVAVRGPSRFHPGPSFPSLPRTLMSRCTNPASCSARSSATPCPASCPDSGSVRERGARDGKRDSPAPMMGAKRQRASEPHVFPSVDLSQSVACAITSPARPKYSLLLIQPIDLKDRSGGGGAGGRNAAS